MRIYIPVLFNEYCNGFVMNFACQGCKMSRQTLNQLTTVADDLHHRLFIFSPAGAGVLMQIAWVIEGFSHVGSSYPVWRPVRFLSNDFQSSIIKTSLGVARRAFLNNSR